MAIVELESLAKRFRFTWALRGVTASFGEGLYLIVGANGSGKTTLLKLVNGMLRPTRGRVRVYGVDPWRSYPLLRGRVAFSYEGLPLPWWMTGRGFLEAVAEMRGGAAPLWEAAKRLGVTGYLDRPVAVYSSGMKKRLLLLMALGFEADLYILDEPFTLIDAAARRVVAEEVAGLGEAGKTVLLSTHLLERKVVRAAAGVVCLEDGRVATGCPGALVDSYA